jgi:5-methylcytosine-specific restriction endonuclease McrA
MMQALRPLHEASSPPGSLHALRTLVLNADYRPLSTYPLSTKPVRKAVENIVKGKVDIVEDWGLVFRSPSLTIPLPRVVVLRDYAPIYGEPKFCRRSIFLRDKFRCQYCGEPFPSHELTYDHVVPRAKGGKTTWENVVAACIDCNALKRDQTANHSGRRGVLRADGRLRPLKEPRRPSAAELLRAGLEFLPRDVREDFGSWIYWSAELRA